MYLQRYYQKHRARSIISLVRFSRENIATLDPEVHHIVYGQSPVKIYFIPGTARARLN